MLTEWLLMSVLKVPWSQTHSEAHNLEHTVSEMIEEQMRINLGNPKTCPHGNPMPGFESVTSSWLPLIDIASGETVMIRRIHELGENDSEFLKFLEENGIIPGAKVEISEILPFNQTIAMKLKDRIYIEKVLR
jgi:DtxR family Mn-dependent transcriptional regulator